jgi:hypothetical protein
MEKMGFTNSHSVIITIATIILLINSCALAQQAWTQKKGEGYFQIGASSFNYSSAADDDFKSFDLARPITEIIISLYAEYGITNKLTGTVIVPFHFVSSGELNSKWLGFAPEEGNLTTFGNLNLALTYRIYAKKDFVLSSKLASSINTSNYDVATGLRTGYDAFGISPTILAGIGTDVFFSSAETGINILTGGYLSRFIFKAQIGKELTKNKRLIGIFVISTNTALGNASNEDNLNLNRTSAFTALYQNEQTYYAGIVKFGYKLSDYWGLWLSIGGGYAKNIGRNPVYSLAFAYNFR